MSASPASVISATLISLGLALFSASSASAALILEAEVNPDPVQPNQMMDSQITVSNPDLSETGALTLRVLWPEELNATPITTGGVSCPGGSCNTGEFLTWDLGILGPATSVTVSFNETVKGATADGSFIALELELLEAAIETETLSLSIEVQTDSPLEVSIDPLSDPVLSGATLVYELVYSNTSAARAENTELELPVPAGTQFVSATGGGVFAGGSVSWDLDSLAPNSGGRERVTVQLDALTTGTLLLVEAAKLSGDVNFLPKESRAMAVSRVADGPLELGLEVDPSPVVTNQSLNADFTVSNPTGSVTGALTLRVLWPEELNANPVGTSGVSCPGGSCNTGEYLTWDLGVLGPATGMTVSFNVTVKVATADGTLIPLEAELLEGGLPARNNSTTVIIQIDSPLELAVDPLPDPVVSGTVLVYELVYSNTGSASAKNTVMKLPVPAGTQFVSTTGAGVLVGDSVSWDIGSLAPNSGGSERVTVQVDALADGTLLVVNAATLAGDVNSLPRNTRTMSVSRVADELLELKLDINPDPVQPNQLLDSQITVSNPALSATGTLTLRVLWPEELNATPITTGGVSCPGGSCNTGEHLIWDLGVLGPATSMTVSFNETVKGTPADGTLIPLEVSLLEGGFPARNSSHTVIVQVDSPLELSVAPLPDPVASGATLVYELIYGNTGIANAGNTVLKLPVPVGTQFVSATGGGVLTGDSVSWVFGTLAPNGGGRERVTVQVDALADGTLLVVNAATLSGEVNFLPRETQAMAVSRVADGPLELSMDVDPNPVIGNQLLNVDITVGNPTGSPTGTLTLRVLWPEELNSVPDTTPAVSCPGGSCNPGEYLTWDLGVLGPSVNSIVNFNVTVRGTTADGMLIPLEVELIEGGFPARSIFQTVLVNPFTDFDNDGEADVFDEDDDNDGMPDWWEIEHGLDPFDAGDANDDPDEDGSTNLEEFIAGTDPNVNNNIVFRDGFES